MDDLDTKARILKETSHFTGNTEGSELTGKQAIFLALCGLKPVSEATSGKWKEFPGGRTAIPDDGAEIAKLLDSLGLAYAIRSDEYATDVVVSLDHNLVEQYNQTDNMAESGRLFGYPESAIAAFDTNDALAQDEDDKLFEAAGLSFSMPQFRLSKTHAAEEIAVLKGWYEKLKEYDLV